MITRKARSRERYLSGVRGAQPLLGAMRLAGQMVSTHLYPTKMAVVADDAMPVRMSHDWQRYTPLLQRKLSALRNGAPFADMPAPLATTCIAIARFIFVDLRPQR